MSAAGRHRPPGRTTGPDVGRRTEDDRAAPRTSAVQRMFDEALARTAGQAQVPLQRFLAVLLAGT